MSSDFQPLLQAANTTAPKLDVPEEIIDDIRSGVFAALFVAAGTLIGTLFALYSTGLGQAVFGEEGFGLSASAFLDVGLMLVLAFGIYKKSRVAAILMFVYYIISQIFMLIQLNRANVGFFLIIVIVNFLFKAVRGTWRYNKLLKEHNAAVRDFQQNSPSII